MLLRTSLLLLALLSYASPALAAWGENWAVMVWGMAAPSGCADDGRNRAWPASTRVDGAGD